jgi:eukaryotic-like serine/threonine-protein kinase
METPKVEGLQVLELMDYGGCGRVFRTEDEDGKLWSLKVFDDMAISRALLGRMTARLGEGGWPEGVLPVISSEFGRSPAFRVSPWIADRMEDGSWRPRSLQHHLDEHPGPDTWRIVRELARTLAAMHERRVPHGNLKPGNVLIGDDGKLLLTDWTLGNMPGVHLFHFTDALLYQAPEQLREPGGHVEEAGYRWDVFSFGVLAFRLLTGSFPRCHETFSLVAPPPGVTRCEGLKADQEKIARNLAVSAVVPWPDDPENPLERGFRECIDRCFRIDPRDRPFSMMEVAAGFEAVEKQIATENERSLLIERGKRADRRASRSLFAFGAATAMVIVFGCLWQFVGSQLSVERAKRKSETAELRTAADQARAGQSAADVRTREAEQKLAYERELGLARLEASRLIGDRLFAWAMEKGHRRLPPLDGRELRLKRLERYFEDFLTRTASIETLADERARARLQLSEISLAAGDVPEATRRLDEALAAWSALPMDADLKFRVATNSLLLALLRQSNSDPQTEVAFDAARKAFAAVPRADVDEDLLDQRLAILDFHEAKLLAAKGDDTKALEQLMRATQTLNRISDHRPDAVILRSNLADCYLSSATILEGIGSLGDAREVRVLASQELTKILEEKPGDPHIQLDLAGCYGAMAEASLLSGDVAGAESLSAQALKLLDACLIKRPEDAEALARKAAQLGLRAGIQRDRGLAAEAIEGYNEGIRMLEGIHASDPGNALVSYRLALLWWQKGRMLGMGGERDQEIALISKARDLLGKLEAAPASAGPRPEQLQRSGAYLSGDLGHALQLAGDNEKATRAFGEAATLWESLLGSRPRSEEYSEGLNWCRQRIEELRK